MAKQTFDISFYCRESKTNRLGLAPIEMSICINGKRSYVALPMKATPKDFALAMKGKGFPEIQDYCRTARKKIDGLVMEMQEEDIPLTTDMLKQLFKNGGVKKTYTIGDLFSEYISILRKRVGKDLSPDTFNRYKKTTEMFMLYNNIGIDTPVKIITLQHMLQYQAALNERLDPATSCNYLQKIKTFFKYAFETGKISSNPCYGLKIDKGVKDTVLYLTPEELAKIENHTFSTARLQEVADVFLFSCYTGLSIGDISALKKEDFKENQYGYLFIEKKRKKTGVPFCAVLLKDAKKIAEKYNYELPIKSTQKTNEYLKEIATVCGTKPLHFHMARHSAAAYLINYRPAIPNETIMRIMGWKNEKQLRHYASIFNATVFDDIKNAFGSNEPKDEDERDREIFRKILDF